eukprot:CAMPEP_0177647078 /NCGR_PEP_ID=MMETSP0447-20121125/10113_1 /TAXON_ID=0 /ORGANISM="Stygamoeba regulata, Strain BSH-02190019" /LENGTH=158 /DNA_ID=CAMNT_0019149649 /DNA_START=14 /DNA_END=490 /DNA_ORIENTATION=-
MAEQQKKPFRALVAFENTEIAGALIDHALRFLDEGDELYLLTVVEKQLKEDASFIRRQVGKHFDEKIKAKGLKAIDLVLSGDPRKQICEAVIKNDIEMLFLGDRNHKTSLPGLLLGSATDYCVKHAVCTVVVVKDRTDIMTAAAEADKKGGLLKKMGL